MLQTAYGALFTALELQPKRILLVRGGTTSVGLAAAAIARNAGAVVVSTTRKADKETFLRDHGVHYVVVDDGNVCEKVRKIFPDGVDKAWELIGTTTLQDSLKCVRKGGAVCMSGMVGNSWSLPNFSPMESIPTAVNLTTYSGGSEEFMQTPLDQLCKQVLNGTLTIPIGMRFKLDQIVEAHQCMEDNKAQGKIVVLT
jgi:NADPH:quinone reductase-like Zn-dependent oxidoreductase